MDKMLSSLVIEKPTMEDIFSYLTEEEMLLLYNKGIEFLPIDSYIDGKDLFGKFLQEINRVGKVVANREWDPDFDHLAVIFNTYVRDSLISINKSWYSLKGVPNSQNYVIYINDMLPRILRQMYTSFFIDSTNKYLYHSHDNANVFNSIIHAEMEKLNFLNDEKDYKIYTSAVLDTVCKKMQTDNNDTYLCPGYNRFLKNAEKIGKVFNYFIYLSYIDNSTLAQECASLMD